jgi:hypothetical protein
MYEEFHDKRFVRLAYISHGQIYNFRKGLLYRKHTLEYQHTNPVFNNEIGIREKPNPLGPGYLRVDSVHGGEKEGQKGVYYINLVDEITQWEVVVCVEGISERFLEAVWRDIWNCFPFGIVQFHSDNGSEFVNKIVAELLNKLNIRQSKSRPRHSNDNGLVETKNGWVIRKHFGYAYVASCKAPLINRYLQKYFNLFLNYHRPCAFPEEVKLENGKVQTVYKRKGYKIPYDKLKEVDPEGKTLKAGQGYEFLDKIAYADTDFEFVEKMNKEYLKLLKAVL